MIHYGSTEADAFTVIDHNGDVKTAYEGVNAPVFPHLIEGVIEVDLTLPNKSHAHIEPEFVKEPATKVDGFHEPREPLWGDTPSDESREIWRMPQSVKRDIAKSQHPSSGSKFINKLN